MCNGIFLGGKERTARKADNLTAVSRLSRKMWELRHGITLWACTACYKDGFTFVTLQGRSVHLANNILLFPIDLTYLALFSYALLILANHDHELSHII
jgi:hypothetical protein